MSPLGFEITPELEAEVAADPWRMPTGLQTPELRDSLIASLAEGRVGRPARGDHPTGRMGPG